MFISVGSTRSTERPLSREADDQILSLMRSIVVSFHQLSFSFIFNISCCNTDGCNVAKQSTMIPAGSLQCYSCNHNGSECTANLTCNEIEVCSMTPGNNSRQLYGCISKNFCNNITMSQTFFRNCFFIQLCGWVCMYGWLPSVGGVPSVWWLGLGHVFD
uniref:UPAR/Ly6 domain-containing protein n=1 Tax=Knipowitschia caucasica TaxID=637954 RepID=A0AAV2JAK8_KNICA